MINDLPAFAVGAMGSAVELLYKIVTKNYTTWPSHVFLIMTTFFTLYTCNQNSMAA